jgi:methyltransferase-like protein
MPHDSNGFTQKEMLVMILDGQEKINDRIDSLHEKVNSKVSRAELSGWIVAVASLAVVVQALM